MTTQAENHLILIDAARAMHERHRQLLAASLRGVAMRSDTMRAVSSFDSPCPCISSST